MVHKGLLERMVSFYHQLEEEKFSQDKAYLKEQLEEKRSAINEQLEGLRNLSCTCLEKSEIHELVKKADEELTAAKEIEEELDEKFSIFVIGNGNSGKSTLVNALIGQEAAEMSATPKTWKIDVFQGEPVSQKSILKELGPSEKASLLKQDTVLKQDNLSNYENIMIHESLLADEGALSNEDAEGLSLKGNLGQAGLREASQEEVSRQAEGFSSVHVISQEKMACHQEIISQLDVINESESDSGEDRLPEVIRQAEIIRQTADGRVKQVVEAEEARKIIEEEDAKRTSSLEEIEAILEDKMIQIEALAKQKNLSLTQKLALEEQYRQKLYAEKLYISPVTEVRWPLKEEGLLRHFQVVDTPGLTQDLNGLIVNDSIKEYYRKADGILCVLDINKVADESIMSLIKKVEAELKSEGINCDSERTLGILNRCDHIKQEEQIKSLVEQAKQLYQGHFEQMLPFSAKKALEGKLYEKQELLEASGYGALETYINEHFLYESSSVKMKKRVHLLKLAQEQLKESVITYKEVLETKDAQRKRIGEKLEKDIEELTQLTHQRINALIVTYKEKVGEHIEEWVPKLFESSFNKEQKIEHAIFEVAHLNEMIQDLVEVLSEEIRQTEQVYRELMGISEDEIKAETLREGFTKEEEKGVAEQMTNFELSHDLELGDEPEVRTVPVAVRNNQNIDDAEAAECSEQIEMFKETQNDEMNRSTESIDPAENIISETRLVNQEGPEIHLNLNEMKVSTLLEQGWLQFLNKYQVVKKLLKLTRGQACRKELIAHLEQMTASLEEELNQVLIREIENLSVRMIQLGEEHFKSFYGSSKVLETQIHALNALEDILSRSYKEKTIIDYIKGERTAWK